MGGAALDKDWRVSEKMDLERVHNKVNVRIPTGTTVTKRTRKARRNMQGKRSEKCTEKKTETENRGKDRDLRK